jgi:hypothetical protein
LVGRLSETVVSKLTAVHASHLRAEPIPVSPSALRNTQSASLRSIWSIN